ncbi:nuclear transport factor 2 family protein [Blastomonas aquatica]|uniref:DUF4440 domain-containing protein n=1 Tax=Blastomonas aquatica TaxID=1510276 RepID=A0ABQ1IY42_9SPHN|nr:nuclear transport factor 2 family protein [Blastomonas aquatica]GGB53205.1 hypothetical protein GCM10010833_04830 [Blastomonas aquatica]
MRNFAARTLTAASLACIAVPASAGWKAANPDVEKAVADPRIAAALAAATALDRATIADDFAAFAQLLADDLAVNNPQNGVSVQGATAQRNARRQISYSRYDRSIEYAGVRGGMVVLMGEEVVTPKLDGAATPAAVHRRFTDLWKQVDGRWLLTARQATIIAR